MQPHRLLLPFLSLITLAALPVPAWAKGTVQLELVGDAQGSAMLFQEWGQTLGQAGIRNVRIRNAQETDKLGIETQGTADSPVYVVTGMIVSRDELLLPGGRFRRSETVRLAQWLKDLAERGPTAGKEEKAAFGLSAAQFQKVRIDLATPVGSTTQGMSRQAGRPEHRRPAETATETGRRRCAGVGRRQGGRRPERLRLRYGVGLRAASGRLLSGAARHRRRDGLHGGQGPAQARGLAGRLDAGEAGQRSAAGAVRVPQRERAERFGCHGVGGDRPTR